MRGELCRKQSRRDRGASRPVVVLSAGAGGQLRSDCCQWFALQVFLPTGNATDLALSVKKSYQRRKPTKAGSLLRARPLRMYTRQSRGDLHASFNHPLRSISKKLCDVSSLSSALSRWPDYSCPIKSEKKRVSICIETWESLIPVL